MSDITGVEYCTKIDISVKKKFIFEELDKLKALLQEPNIEETMFYIKLTSHVERISQLKHEMDGVKSLVGFYQKTVADCLFPRNMPELKTFRNVE